MKKSILIIILSILILPLCVEAADPVFEWTRTEDVTEWDKARDVISDSSSNVYVIGGGAGLIKYNRDGMKLWQLALPSCGKLYSYDRSPVIALDSQNNPVVVCATRYVGTTTYKVDTNGNELWSSFHSAANLNYNQVIKIDSADNVYVGETSQVGSGGGWSTPIGFHVMKYDRDGNLVWDAKRKDGVQSQFEDMAVDALGNVYVTGIYISGSLWSDYGSMVTAKFDSNGDFAWIRSYNRGWGTERGTNVSITSSGEIIVGGYSNNGYWPVIVKYDTYGNELWVKTPSLFIGYYSPHGMELDSNDNIYIGGCEGALKLDPNGDVLWGEAVTNAPCNYGPNMILAPSGTPYIIPSASRPTSIQKLDPDTGAVQWTLPLSNSAGSMRKYHIDSSGNIYMTGEKGHIVDGVIDYDYSTVKYRQFSAEDYLNKLVDDIGAATFGWGNQQRSLLAHLDNALDALTEDPSDTETALAELNVFQRILCNMKNQGKMDDATYTLLYTGYSDTVSSIGEAPKPAC